MKEFFSSILLILSWLLVAGAVYLLVLSISFAYALIPALFALIAALILKRFSKALQFG